MAQTHGNSSPKELFNMCVHLDGATMVLETNDRPSANNDVNSSHNQTHGRTKLGQNCGL